MGLMSTNVVYLIAGAALLLASVLPSVLRRWAASAPMVLLGVGLLLGLLPTPAGLNLDPVEVRPIVERTAEVAVLIALMGVGLALDRPLVLGRRQSRQAWWATWRLLLIAMPLTIGGVWVLGWWLLGLAPAVALLLGAVLAPTDPVLAGDVQVAGPQVAQADAGDGGAEPDELDELDELDEEDEVRFALTSEAGLNDGLAFPFVYAALFIAARGASADWVARWLAWEVIGKIAVGTAIGVASGWLLGKVAFRATARSLRLAEHGEPMLPVAALVTTYGLSELAGGYGFLAVFACGMAMRAAERHHEYHREMHQVVEQLERLLTLLILLMIGFAMTRGLLANLDWRSVVVAVALIFVVRPVAGWLSLRFRILHVQDYGGMSKAERAAVSFFGVRGIGSIYYLAYAGGQHVFAEERWLWSTVTLTIALSVLVHGVLATPVLAWLDRRRERSTALTA